MNLLSRLKPQPGRWRPGLMYCDQATCLLYANLRFDEVVRQLNLADLQDSLNSAPDQLSRREAFLHVDQDVKEFNASFAHEQDHLRRQFGTSAGLLCAHLHSRLVYVFFELMTAAATRGDPFPFPLLGRVQRSSAFGEAAGDCKRLFEFHQSEMETNQAALLGLGFSALIDAIENGTKPHSRALAEFAAAALGGDRVFVPQEFIDQEQVRFPEGILSARHLYEHMAMLDELRWLTLLGGSLGNWEKLLTSSTDYHQLMAVWSKFFPDHEHSQVGTIPEGDLITDVNRMYSVEFYAILDLALWPPFTPAGFASEFDITWSDLQPGERMLRAILAFHSSGVEQTPVTSPQRDERFLQVQDAVCGALHWPTPMTLARRWLDYLSGEQWFDDCFLVGQKNEPSIEIARGVLRERLRRPFSVVLNNLSWGDVATARFMLWMTAEENGTRAIHSISPAEPARAARQSFLAIRGAESMLFGTSNRHQDTILSLKPEFRRETIKAIDAACSGDRWDSEYFTENAEEYFSL